jgi:hypothetical protein
VLYAMWSNKMVGVVAVVSLLGVKQLFLTVIGLKTGH